MQINDDIIRFMTIRVDQHEDGPSAMMQSRGGRDRDDRGDRGDRRPPRRDRDDRGDRPRPAAGEEEKA
jgi:small subunit ribosomal protein S6